MTTPETPDDTPPVVPDPGQQPVPPQPAPQQYGPPAYAPPGQPYGPPPAYTPPQRQGFWSTGPGIALILVGALLLFCFGRGAIRGSSSHDGGSDMRVEVTSCSFGDGDRATVGYRVTNNGDSTETARVRIEYRDSSGDRIDTDTAYVRSIAPGDTVRGEESTLLDAPVSSGRCIITGVD